MATKHTFFCCELFCDAEAHVFGGRCDPCFEEHLVKLRNKHNPPRFHSCRGQFDYDLDCYVCDDRDDPLCPFNRSQEACDWYWFNGQRHRLKKSCADCGYIPEDGHFPAYRGHDPLCATCEEKFYGPPSPEDWRERTGNCTKCNLFFDLICSSDDRTCCPPCAAKGALPPVEQLDECPGCGGSCRPGAAGYCSACWQQRYGCEDE